MLPRENRLRSKNDFQRVLQTGKTFFTREIGMRFQKNSLKISRFAFVVSVKVEKKAVARNKIKRKLREIIRLNIAKIYTGYDMIFFVRKGSLEKKYFELREIISYMLWKSRLINEKFETEKKLAPEKKNLFQNKDKK